MPALGYTQLHSLSLITVVHFSPSTVTLYPSSIRHLLCLFPPSIFYDSTQCWFILSCLFFSKLCVPVYFFIIDGKCRVLFIKSNLFFSKHDFWKWPTCYACSREANFWKSRHAAAAVALYLFRERSTKPKGKFLSCWRKNKMGTSVASDIHWKGRPSPKPINSKASL